MRSAKLGDLCAIQSGGTPSRKNPDFYGGAIPWAKISDIETSNGLLTSTDETITDEGLTAIRGRIFTKGTLLFAIYGSIGKLAFAGRDLCTNQAILGIANQNPRDLFDRYLFRYLEAHRNDFLRDGSGIAQKNLSAAYVRNLSIPLPPLEEQKRIAGILDQAAKLCRLRSRALDTLNTLGQAIFHDMFGDPATNPMGWKKGTIGDLLLEAKYGTAKKANTERQGMPILRMSNLTYDGRIDLSDLKHIELPENDLPKYTTRQGDLLFNRTNSKELVGKTAVVTTSEPMAIAGYLVRARTNESGNPHYISALMNSKYGKETLRNMCKNIVGMANINAKEFQTIRLPVPPKELQDEFAEKLSALEPLEEKLAKGLSVQNTLFASLQHRAFRGDL